MSEELTRGLRPTIRALVFAIALFMVGVVTVAVVQGVGSTILTSLNTSGTITVPDYLAQVGAYVSPVISIIGVGLLIAGAVWIIMLLMNMAKSAGLGEGE